MRVAIHQPNFMPWLGFFHRLAMVRRFVVFDHVQAMGGRSWLSRNRILVAGAPAWLSLPVLKAGRLGQAVRDVEISSEAINPRKHLRTLELSYGKTPFAAPFLEMVQAVYGAGHRYIADFNVDFIQRCCTHLDLNVEFVSSSRLAADDPSLLSCTGNDLVLRICQAAGGTEYVSGTGCLDFIQPESFERAGIPFYFQEFVHPVYPQRGMHTFVSHLSIFDALCHLGADKVRDLVRQPGLERPVRATHG